MHTYHFGLDERAIMLMRSWQEAEASGQPMHWRGRAFQCSYVKPSPLEDAITASVNERGETLWLVFYQCGSYFRSVEGPLLRSCLEFARGEVLTHGGEW